MNFGLSENTIKRFHEVFVKYPEIEEVIIYGSRSKDTYREGSDIDITLVGENITEEMRSKVCLDIDGLNTPYLVDLSIFYKLDSQNLIEHIERVGKIFYKKK